MRKLSVFLILLFTVSLARAQYDIVIVGGNPAGITAAISAARLGKSVLILERTQHIGGLPVNGLGATDIATRGATTGLFTEFTTRIKQYYLKKYGENSGQVKACSDGYHFEPSVAEQIFEQMLMPYKSKITILTMRQFDANQSSLSIVHNSITEISALNRVSQKIEKYTAKIFIDASYEGDLTAAAGVPFRVGREGKSEFNEPGAGRVYKLWKGPEEDGTTHQADNGVQAYNYRLCLTNNPLNRAKINKPLHYDRSEYLSLVGDVLSGRNTGVASIEKGDTSTIPGDPWGINKIVNMVPLPNQKNDANNQHLAFLSTDLPEENWPWPTSGWEWRDRFAERLKNYTLGLIYFAQNDQDLPENYRKAALEWGFAKDEYKDNNNFPRQVYVREGRRFEGLYFFTAKDAIAVSQGKRPPLHANSVTASHYALDSHAVRKREAGKVHLDGFVSYPTDVYTVPYGVMIAKSVDNLLFPVPVSGSHIGFSTIRMEPCWMALGQGAGIAASIAIDHHQKIQDINTDDLQRLLVKEKVTLIYYKDVDQSSLDFEMVQYMGLRGYLPDWEAHLDDSLAQGKRTQCGTLYGFKLNTAPKKYDKRAALKQLYNALLKKIKNISSRNFY
jgi:hypothetical protein